MKVRINDNTIHLYLFACTLHSTIQVWGLLLFIYFRALSEPLLR